MTVPSEGPAGGAHQLLGEGVPEAVGAMTFPATPGPLPKAQGPSWSPLGVPEDRNTESLTLRTDRSTESPAGARLHPQMPNAITPSLFQLTSQGGERPRDARECTCVCPAHACLDHTPVLTHLSTCLCMPACISTRVLHTCMRASPHEAPTHILSPSPDLIQHRMWSGPCDPRQGPRRCSLSPSTGHAGVHMHSRELTRGRMPATHNPLGSDQSPDIGRGRSPEQSGGNSLDGSHALGQQER